MISRCFFRFFCIKNAISSVLVDFVLFRDGENVFFNKEDFMEHINCANRACGVRYPLIASQRAIARPYSAG